jgi:hypothetical protein
MLSIRDLKEFPVRSHDNNFILGSNLHNNPSMLHSESLLFTPVYLNIPADG